MSKRERKFFIVIVIVIVIVIASNSEKSCYSSREISPFDRGDLANSHYFAKGSFANRFSPSIIPFAAGFTFAANQTVPRAWSPHKKNPR